MLPQEIIRIKRDGGKISAADMQKFVRGVADKTISEAQVGAFCMAVVLKKMDMEERIALTLSMARSGSVLDWSKENLKGPVLDKHSTGGVGDKTSLMLAPIIAACGGYVPMISGRGLGHTGGTLDKMDSIPGYVSQPDAALFRKTVREVGCAIIGATSDLAPADRVMYAVRDVTATVESLDLITASILSKKLAAGLQGLVMDVKFGSGAFMREDDDAHALADSIVKVANGAGLPTVCLLTDMNQVLGCSAGNAVEVLEAVAFLKGEEIDQRLYDVTKGLCTELLVLGGLAKDVKEAGKKVDAALQSGRAAEHFSKMVAALGGPSDFVEAPENYVRQAAVIRDFHFPNGGILSGLDVFKVGLAIVEAGGGRMRPSDTIDHAVGLTNVAQLGADLSARPLATLHAKDDATWNKMAAALSDAVTVNGEVTIKELIKARITA